MGGEPVVSRRDVLQVAHSNGIVPDFEGKGHFLAVNCNEECMIMKLWVMCASAYDSNIPMD